MVSVFVDRTQDTELHELYMISHEHTYNTSCHVMVIWLVYL